MTLIRNRKKKKEFVSFFNWFKVGTKVTSVEC